MNIINISRLVAILREVEREPSNRKAHIREFQEILGRSSEPSEIIPQELSSRKETICETLDELAYDLNFYEEDWRIRQEDPSYYGDERLVLLIQTAFDKLRKEGVLVA